MSIKDLRFTYSFSKFGVLYLQTVTNLTTFMMKFVHAIKKSLRIYVWSIHFRPQKFMLKRHGVFFDLGQNAFLTRSNCGHFLTWGIDPGPFMTPGQNK